MPGPTPQEQVTEFHRGFDVPFPGSNEPASLETSVLQARRDLRMELIFEEFLELVEAVWGLQSAQTLRNVWPQAKSEDEQVNDVVETADALGDLVYVIYGMAIEANIPLDEVVKEIHSSNMSKLGSDGKPMVSDGVTPAPDGEVKPKGKVLKGPAFRLPDVAAVLSRGIDFKS